MKYWFIACLACLSCATGAVAGGKHGHHHHHHEHHEEHRQLSAHEHGSGNFNIAIEGKKVSMELESPGADIVGFEYEATTDEQKARIAKAKAKLKDIANVVALPAAAGCKLEAATVELETEGQDKKTSHSEFRAHYQMTCAQPEKLAEITFPYFRNFKGAQKLAVRVVGPKSQKKFEAGRKMTKINLGGLV